VTVPGVKQEGRKEGRKVPQAGSSWITILVRGHGSDRARKKPPAGLASSIPISPPSIGGRAAGAPAAEKNAGEGEPLSSRLDGGQPEVMTRSSRFIQGHGGIARAHVSSSGI